MSEKKRFTNCQNFENKEEEQQRKILKIEKDENEKELTISIKELDKICQNLIAKQEILEKSYINTIGSVFIAAKKEAKAVKKWV